MPELDTADYATNDLERLLGDRGWTAGTTQSDGWT